MHGNPYLKRYFSFKSSSIVDLDDIKVRKWLAQRGSTGTGTIDDADREMAKHDHDQHTWLHVLVEQGNNSVLWKVRTIRI